MLTDGQTDIGQKVTALARPGDVKNDQVIRLLKIGHGHKKVIRRCHTVKEKSKPGKMIVDVIVIQNWS